MQQVGSISGPTLESLTVPRYKSVRGFHVSSLLMPPTPTSTTRTSPPLGRSIGVVLWTVLFFFCGICVFFFASVLFAKLHKYNDTLANWQTGNFCCTGSLSSSTSTVVCYRVREILGYIPGTVLSL